MNPMPDDPYNHAPAVSPGDMWEDAGEMAFDSNGAVTILPPRRPLPERSPAEPAGGNGSGVRIDTWLHKQPEKESRQLDVREIDGSVIRLAPEEPAVPKMERHVVFRELEAGKKQESEGKDWGKATQFSMRWMLGICAGVGALVIASLALVPFVNRSNAAGAPNAVVLMKDEVMPLEDGDEFRILVGGMDEALRVFREFMTSPDADGLIPLLRDADGVMPLVVSSGRSTLVSKRWKPEKTAAWEVRTANGRPFGFLKGDLPDFSPFHAYFAAVEGSLRLDWKATTGYGTATFEELGRNQGDPTEIRGTIMPGGHYSSVLPEEDFQCYQLASPDGEQAVWAYARRGDAVNEALSLLFQGGGILEASSLPHKVTVRLERVQAGARDNQWLIGELLHEEWIQP